MTRRAAYLLILPLVLIVGLTTRNSLIPFPNFIKIYGGDTFWALFAYLLLRFFWIKLSTIKIAGLSLGFSFLIEITQLYHNEWIDNIRDTTIGGLVFGFGFLWTDFICYSVGILFGIIIDLIIGKYR